MSGMSREREALRRLKLHCLRRGLTIGYVGGGSMAGAPEEAQTRLQQGREDVDTAAYLGAQLLRVFARRPWPDTQKEQDALWGGMIAGFQELSDYAADRGVAIGLQNHNEGSIAATADRVLRILDDVDRDNFTLVMDTGQWQGAIGSHPRGESDPEVDLYADYLEPTAPRAAYVRAKIYKIDSGVEEFLDYDRILQILRDVGYNGTLGLVLELGERNTCSYEEAAGLAARHLRSVIAQATG